MQLFQIYIFFTIIFSFVTIVISVIDCGRGFYKDGDSCIPCPRGTYGLTSGLPSSDCSALCPLGKYGEKLAAISEDDCTLCPPGTYGNQVGLTTSRCSGRCNPGKYSSLAGQTSISACVNCPPGYRGNQCNYWMRGLDSKGVDNGPVYLRASKYWN